jgi:hypothetical protein
MEAAESAPKGAFGQAYPQARPSRSWLDGPSAAVSHGRVVPCGKHKAAARVDVDGLPMPGETVLCLQCFIALLGFVARTVACTYCIVWLMMHTCE